MANPNSLTFLREDFLVDRVALQRTTFTIDALGRFLCNTWTETTGAILDPNLLAASGAFDAVVIGGGTYGAYCAEKIWRRGGKVLVLEAGDFLVSEHTQNLTDMGWLPPVPFFQVRRRRASLGTSSGVRRGPGTRSPPVKRIASAANRSSGVGRAPE